MEQRGTLALTKQGIAGGVECLPLRQVLMVPCSTLQDFGLNPGDLRENIITEDIDLHTIESGRVINIGEARVRVTFHCEPCQVIKDKVNLREVKHRRGVLGAVVKPGNVQVGDRMLVGPKLFDTIPYGIGDRIKWYLDQQDRPVHVLDLVHEVGLSKSYCRAVPSIVRSRGDIDPEMILYGQKAHRPEGQLIFDFA